MRLLSVPTLYLAHLRGAFEAGGVQVCEMTGQAGGRDLRPSTVGRWLGEEIGINELASVARAQKQTEGGWSGWFVTRSKQG